MRVVSLASDVLLEPASIDHSDLPCASPLCTRLVLHVVHTVQESVKNAVLPTLLPVRYVTYLWCVSYRYIYREGAYNMHTPLPVRCKSCSSYTHTVCISQEERKSLPCCRPFRSNAELARHTWRYRSPDAF